MQGVLSETGGVHVMKRFFAIMLCAITLPSGLQAQVGPGGAVVAGTEGAAGSSGAGVASATGSLGSTDAQTTTGVPDAADTSHRDHVRKGGTASSSDHQDNSDGATPANSAAGEPPRE